MRAPRVLVVEDDARLRDVILRGLRSAPVDLAGAPDGATALRLASPPADPFDVIVLDIGLPDADGRDVCQALRSRGVTAMVLFLTARGQTGDQLSGFAAGGDDYLAKPFDFAVLQARILALARRHSATADRMNPTSVRLPDTADPPHLDPASHALIVGTTRIPLTPTEFRILGALIGAGDRVVRRHEVLAAAWPAQAIVHDNTLDQYLTRIRRKLAQVPDPPVVATVHGVGYRFVSGGAGRASAVARP